MASVQKPSAREAQRSRVHWGPRQSEEEEEEEEEKEEEEGVRRRSRLLLQARELNKDRPSRHSYRRVWAFRHCSSTGPTSDPRPVGGRSGGVTAASWLREDCMSKDPRSSARFPWISAGPQGDPSASPRHPPSPTKRAPSSGPRLCIEEASGGGSGA
ncbi:unnamed protein product [Prorocentrum cordatum]|uniref:Uncharacterized protein n=1 Tax=Prorocentrum cordatum TaxID=2364126 RepID=A0ABN9Q264_9DINO|nr:unnamed protein product [Polarella glacialis]